MLVYCLLVKIDAQVTYYQHIGMNHNKAFELVTCRDLRPSLSPLWKLQELIRTVVQNRRAIQ